MQSGQCRVQGGVVGRRAGEPRASSLEPPPSPVIRSRFCSPGLQTLRQHPLPRLALPRTPLLDSVLLLIAVLGLSLSLFLSSFRLFFLPAPSPRPSRLRPLSVWPGKKRNHCATYHPPSLRCDGASGARNLAPPVLSDILELPRPLFPVSASCRRPRTRSGVSSPIVPARWMSAVSTPSNAQTVVWLACRGRR